MNRGNRYRFLRYALVLVIIGLIIAGACLGSPSARRNHSQLCPDRAGAAGQAFRAMSANCRLVPNR